MTDGGVLPNVAADPAAAVASAVGAAQSHNWPVLVAIGLAIAAFSLRRFAPQFHYLQSPRALLVVSAVAGILGGVSQGIYQHGFSVVAIVYGAGAATMTALAMGNPSLPSGSSSDTAVSIASISSTVKP